MRFILWSGEEQGLLGSRAYVEKLGTNVEKIVAVLNDDGGTNYHGGYVGLASQKGILEAAFAPTVAAFPDLPMKFDVVEQAPAGGSSDHAPFIWAGVPAYFTKESGRADYGYVWHTQNDRYENAIPEYLVQSATNHALVGFHLATINEKLPRFQPRPRTGNAEILNHALAIGADRMYADPHSHGSQDHDHEDDYILEVFDRLKRIAPKVFRAIRK
jgi:Zn-dependent M28 family amino/carboxypeptidase